MSVLNSVEKYDYRWTRKILPIAIIIANIIMFLSFFLWLFATNKIYLAILIGAIPVFLFIITLVYWINKVWAIYIEESGLRSSFGPMSRFYDWSSFAGEVLLRQHFDPASGKIIREWKVPFLISGKRKNVVFDSTICNIDDLLQNMSKKIGLDIDVSGPPEIWNKIE